MVTGVDTVLADDCRLTLRADELPLDGDAKDCALAHPPARMVLDSKGRTPADARILAGGATTVVTTEQSALGEAGQAVVLAADAEGRIDIHAWVQYLGEQAFNEIMVEAGPTLSGALLRGGWVDRLIIYQAPKLLGDEARAMAAMNFPALAEAPEFEINEVTRIGSDLRIMAAPRI
jgi:diaminohydroxyphosphoribosylaminopyrimidine deaminase/5-amino-6-(5-phosphoribosylamino)uracil reductase